MLGRFRNKKEDPLALVDKFLDKLGEPNEVVCKPICDINVFYEMPNPKAVTYITSGISIYEFPLGDSSNDYIRQELVLTIDNTFHSDSIYYFIDQIASNMTSHRDPIRPEEMIDLQDFGLSDRFGNISSFIAATGVWFSIGELVVSEHSHVVIVELVPVTESEEEIISTNFSAFKEMTKSGAIDLLDFNR